MKPIEELGISPTPWIAESYDEVDHHYVVDNSEYAIFLLSRSKNGKANARFIAAAPKMYEKAYSVLNNLLVHLKWPEETIRMNRAEVAAMAKELQEALAEASGEVSNG